MGIKAIAERAGVSTATVSHVINGSRFVSSELTERVRAAMKELDYYPNSVAGSLRRKRTMSVGFLMPDSANTMWAGTSKRFESELAKSQYNVLLSYSNYDVAQEIEKVKAFRSRRVDAMVIMPATPNGGHIQSILRGSVPMVVVGTEFYDTKAHCVWVDNVRVGYLAVSHLIGLGHRKIGFIDRKVDHDYSAARRRGVIVALEEGGINPDKLLMLRAKGYGFDAGYEAAKTLLDQGSPTGVFAYNDIMAVGAMRAVVETGRRIPEDVSVVGCDDIPLAAFVEPPLTTVHYPIEQLADVGAQMVLELLENEEPELEDEGWRNIRLSPRLVVRHSTAKGEQ
jgi:LacI family transcriptional regulator